MSLFKKKEDSEIKIGNIDYGALREFAKAVKDQKREKRGEAMKGIFKSLGNALPKGIKNPDDLVVNMHLYTPMKGKRKTRLF
jgi:hypothetical protein